MKPHNEQLITTLKALIEGQVYSLVGDAPYEIVSWEVEEKGPFSLENFLVDNQGLIPFESEYFFNRLRQSQTQEAIAHYQTLLSLLQTHLSELKIYGYRLIQLPTELKEGFPVEGGWFGTLGIPMFVGLSSGGEWIGLTLKQGGGFELSPNFAIADLEAVSESTAQLVEEIRAIVGEIEHKTKAGEELSMETNWEVVVTATRQELMQKLLEQTGFLDVAEVNDFIRVSDDYGTEIEEYYQTIAELEAGIENLKQQGDSATEELEEKQQELTEQKEGLEELKTERNFELELREFFASQLLNSRNYNLNFCLSGEWCTVHYALGQTQQEDWIGVVTTSFTL
ncbi:MAG: nuclease A inhibitor family protein [Cyanobacteria bacterium P01_H01_bin.35]